MMKSTSLLHHLLPTPTRKLYLHSSKLYTFSQLAYMREKHSCTWSHLIFSPFGVLATGVLLEQVFSSCKETVTLCAGMD